MRSQLRETLLARIDSPNPSPTELSLEELGAEQGLPLHRIVLGLLSHREMPEEEARTHWAGICARREELARQLQRDPGVRVAAMDYFINRPGGPLSPVAVEEAVLDRTESSAGADGLTGLLSARQFRRFLDQEVRRSARRLQEFAVALLEFDRLSSHPGPSWGDLIETALREAAGILEGRLREMDIAARGEGVRFALLLPRTGRTGAFVALDRIREAVREHFRLHRPLPRRIPLTLSGGIAVYPDDTGSAVSLLRLAGQALIRAQERGGDRIIPFHGERRGSPRFRPAGNHLRVQLSGAGVGPAHGCVLGDVGAGGAFLWSDSVLKIGEEILLELQEEGGSSPVQIPAEVVRLGSPSEPLSDGTAAGVRFRTDARSGIELDALIQRLRRAGVE